MRDLNIITAAGSLNFPDDLLHALNERSEGRISQAALVERSYRWILSGTVWPLACLKEPVPPMPPFEPPPGPGVGEPDDEFRRRLKKHERDEKERMTRWMSHREHVFTRHEQARAFLERLLQWAYEHDDDAAFEMAATKLREQWGIGDALRLVRPVNAGATAIG